MRSDIELGDAQAIKHGKSKLRWVVAFPFPCPHCRKEHFKILPHIEHNPKFTCSAEDGGCGGGVDTRMGEFPVYKAEIAQALDAMGSRYQKL